MRYNNIIKKKNLTFNVYYYKMYEPSLTKHYIMESMLNVLN